MEPAQQLVFTQLRLEPRQKHLYPQICFDYFPLIVTHIHNIPWPRDHLLLYNIAFAIAIAPISTESLVSVRFKLLVSDHFIPFSDCSKRSDSFLARGAKTGVNQV